MQKHRFLHKQLITLLRSRCLTKQSNNATERNMSKGTEGKASVHLREEELVSGKWLGLTKVTFKDPTGKERTWEALRRMTKRPDAPADAVIVIPILKRSLHYDCYILVKQYRPPIKGYTLEFPAGLLDGNESVENCALRELKEETGYTGVAKFTSPVTSLDPGTGSTTGQIVTVEIDGDLLENQNPTPQPGSVPDDIKNARVIPLYKKNDKTEMREGRVEKIRIFTPHNRISSSEFIEVLTIPKDDFLKILNDYTAKGVKADARLYMYAVALEQTKKT